MPEPIKRSVYKGGVFMDVSIAERLGIEGDVEVEHYSDPEEVGAVVFGLTAKEAREIRESVPKSE